VHLRAWSLGSQSNISPAAAASFWIQYFQPLKTQGVRLGAPAVSSAPAGSVWLHSFFAACSSCQIDFIPIVCSLEYIRRYIPIKPPVF